MRVADYNLETLGNTSILKRTKTGLLCSRKCPADKILEAYDQFNPSFAIRGLNRLFSRG